MIEEETIGSVPDGRKIICYTLSNNMGMRARVMTYGATLLELQVPDARGESADVVLGYPTLDDYVHSPNYFGAVIGRVCGRIPHGRFSVDGTEYALVANAPPHHLHGGLQGFDKQVWTLVDADNDILRLRHVSPHGQEGYPGEVDAIVAFRLTDRNELMIRFRAESDRPTPLALAQNNFFNLGGVGSAGIGDHHLTIFAEHRIPPERDLSPGDHCETVHGHPCDLNHRSRLGDILPCLEHLNGELYVVRRTRRGDLVPAARLEHPPSGRVMDIATTEDCLDFNTGRHIQPSRPGKHGKTHVPHQGLGLNCQGHPAGTTCPDCGSIILRPGITYRHQTVLAFRSVPPES